MSRYEIFSHIFFFYLKGRKSNLRSYRVENGKAAMKMTTINQLFLLILLYYEFVARSLLVGRPQMGCLS